MPEIKYRLYLDNEPATREQLDRVDEITVEQQIDMAWEARFQIPICTDANGKWTGEDEKFMAAFSRVRLEVKVADHPYVPLIDGPIVSPDSQMTSEPGQSILTLIVQDDSVYLNREDKINPYENKLDHEVAKEVFGTVTQIASTRIDTDTPPPADGLPVVQMQRGSLIELLRDLAHRHHMYAYVLPGKERGKSVGVFGKLPTKPDGLPELVLLGPDRNVESFNVTNDAQSNAVAETFALSICDKVVTRGIGRFRDLELLGAEGGLKEGDAARRLLPPGNDGVVDPQRAAQAATENAAFSFEASGSVLGSRYTGVLEPYRIVTVKGVNARLSGNYVIKKVTHQLTRSEYTQSFSFLRNAVSGGSAAGGLEDLAGAIF